MEHLVFSQRISGVINGLFGLEVQEMVLSGACLSRREDSVVENRVKYDLQIRGRNAVKRRGKNISRKSCGINGLDSTNLFCDKRRSMKSRIFHNGMNGIVISNGWMPKSISDINVDTQRVMKRSRV